MHATKPKEQSNKTPLTISDDDVWHYDIAYGIGTAIGGIKYSLVITGRANRYTFLYPLTDMKDTSILLAMKHFVSQLGRKPRKMYADRDFKLIGGIVSNFLETNDDTDSMESTSQVTGAPAGRQNQNGLAEIRWKNLLNLSRNWLASNLLPSSFWYFALQYAVQVSNYLPYLHKSTWTSPFELLHNNKPDFRNLHPLFSVAYVKRFKDGSVHRKKGLSQSIKAILVGNDPKSDGKLFYVPHTKSIIGSADYDLDPSHPSGPVFGLTYDGGIQFSLHIPDAQEWRTPTYNQGDKVHLFNDIHQKLEAIIIDIPIKGFDYYTIRYSNSGDYDQVPESYITSLNLSPITLIDSKIIHHLHKWIKNDAKVTLYLHDKIEKAKQGYLLTDDEGEWVFKTGRSRNSKLPVIKLPNFTGIIDNLINTKQLCQGWITSRKLTINRQFEDPKLYSTDN